MILQEVRQHPLEFSILFAILIIGTSFFFAFGHDPHAQRQVVYITGASYFLWSLFHHYRVGDLELSLVVEYLLVSLLATLLLTSTLV